MVSDAELKQRFLELLRSDEGFRLAVAGLLGLDTVINELRKLREDFNKSYESIMKKMDSFERKLIALGARWGIESEEVFRNAMRGVVEEILGWLRLGSGGIMTKLERFWDTCHE
jgi:hypothetical protein